MNSPLVGGGVVPEGEMEVFFSSYLDRVLSLDEQKYVFDVSMYVFLSWIDPRAPAEVAKATNETTSPGGRDCARLCVGQRAPSESSQCCDSMWLPSFVIRNADGLSFVFFSYLVFLFIFEARKNSLFSLILSLSPSPSFSL